MDLPALSVVIPAAGDSRRLGQAKQLVKFRGKPLIQNAIDVAHSLTPFEIIVATGAQAEAITDAVHHPPVRWIHNPHWAAGMGGSIALAAAAVSPESSGLLILLCDQYQVDSDDLRGLVKTWRLDPESIVAAESGGHLMPPVIFPSSCFDALQRLQGDQGARKVLEVHSELVTPVRVKNAAYDLDTPGQLERLNKHM